MLLDRNISCFIDYIMNVDIDLLCDINEYYENVLQILTNTKLYEYNYDHKRYEYYYDSDIKSKIEYVKECIKYIKKFK